MFKVGHHIRVTDMFDLERIPTGVHIGSIGTIIDDPGDGSYEVDFGFGEVWWISEGNMERVK